MVKVLSKEECTLDYVDGAIKANPLVILYFSAEWCGPCKAVANTIQSCSENYPEVDILKIDAEDGALIAKEHRVKSLPTLIFIREGECISRTNGSLSENELSQMISDMLK